MQGATSALFKANMAVQGGGAIYGDESSTSFSANEYNHSLAENRFGFCFVIFGNEGQPIGVASQVSLSTFGKCILSLHCHSLSQLYTRASGEVCIVLSTCPVPCVFLCPSCLLYWTQLHCIFHSKSLSISLLLSFSTALQPSLNMFLAFYSISPLGFLFYLPPPPPPLHCRHRRE